MLHEWHFLKSFTCVISNYTSPIDVVWVNQKCLFFLIYSGAGSTKLKKYEVSADFINVKDFCKYLKIFKVIFVLLLNIDDIKWIVVNYMFIVFWHKTGSDILTDLYDSYLLLR